MTEDLSEGFGELLPFADPSWYQPQWHSPYCNESTTPLILTHRTDNDSHRRLRAYARKFVQEHIMPYVQEWSEANDCQWERPLMLKLAQAQLLPGMLGVYPWPTQYTDIRPPCNIKPEEWDPFHEMVVQDEMARCASGGVMLGLAGTTILLFFHLLFIFQIISDDRIRNCVAARDSLWIGTTEAEDARCGRWQKDHLSQHYRAVRRIRCCRNSRHGPTDARRQTLHCQWREKVDHQCHFRRLLYGRCSDWRQGHGRHLAAAD
jgi:hypothetical protein